MGDFDYLMETLDEVSNQAPEQDSLAKCLPHACGGVSAPCRTARRGQPSSPRMWGCFPKLVVLLLVRTVFPTHVGVFMKVYRRIVRAMSLPHACGGVSVRIAKSVDLLTSSPRMWGCF